MEGQQEAVADQTQTQQKRSDNPTSNQINVSVQHNPTFYVYISKKYLQTFETIELHALGNAVSTSVIASENLVRNNYAEFQEIKTKTITVKGQRGESKKAKLFITLKRGPDYFENMKKFEETRLENEKLKKAKEDKVEGEKAEEQKAEGEEKKE